MAATKSGWYVRVCPTKTEASSIEFYAGLGGDEKSHMQWRDWTPGTETEFDFPSQFQHAEEVWFLAIAHPNGKNVHVCLCFQDHVAQKLEFDHEEQHEVSQADSDECAC